MAKVVLIDYISTLSLDHVSMATVVPIRTTVTMLTWSNDNVDI
jgi:hypothetical protein